MLLLPTKKYVAKIYIPVNAFALLTQKPKRPESERASNATAPWWWCAVTQQSRKAL